MPFEKCRIYSDGSHYIAIAPMKGRERKRREIKEEEIEVESMEKRKAANAESITTNEKRTMTRREYFDELYEYNRDLPRKEIKEEIMDKMRPYFAKEDDLDKYVELNIKRKEKNLSARMVRLYRKVHSMEFNYFCTFTYADEKHTEQSFEKKLMKTLANFTSRDDWQYILVHERGEKSDRLHFHGLFSIPKGQMVGELVVVRDYDTRRHRMQESVQNTYFNERFGRSDFKEIVNQGILNESVRYLTKYMQKSGAKMRYSKGIKEYFITDILDDDVIGEIGQAPNKFLLFDDFKCIKDGEVLGRVSEKIIERMPKTVK